MPGSQQSDILDSESTVWFLNFPFNLTKADRRPGLDLAALEANGVRRGESIFCHQVIGHTPSANRDYSGLIIPYTLPDKPLWEPRAYRIRRDKPDRRFEEGRWKEKNKYIGSPGVRGMLYFVVGTTEESLTDPSIPIIIQEGEFKTMAAHYAALRAGRGFLTVGIQGVYNWLSQGRPISDLDRILFDSRRVILIRDSNVLDPNKRQVMAGWRDFARELNWRGADVYETEAPFGVNGHDDLIERDGDAAFWKLVDDARPMRRYRSPIKKLTPEEKREKAKKLQASTTPEQKLSAVVGRKAQKQMFRLWSEAGLSGDSQHLLSALHVLMADKRDPDATEYDFEYRELFPLLFRTSGYYKKGKLTSAGSKKIRDRVQKLEAEQKQCRITFAVIKPARKDSEGEIIDSHVKLFSQNHIAEIEVQAAESTDFNRGYRNVAREKATIEWVKENAGAAYIEKPEKHKTQNQRISDGLARVKGNLGKTVGRMRERGDSQENIWLSVCEVLPPELLDFIIRKGNSLYKEIHVTPTDPVVVDDDDFPHTEPEPDISNNTAQKTEKVVTQKQDLNQTESTNGHVYFGQNTTKNHTPEDVELWDRVCQKSANARAEKEAEQRAARDALIAEPLPEPGEWENPHTDEFDLPEIRCHCGAELKPMATSCAEGCSYTSFYWSEYCLRSYGIIRDAIWHSVDSDRPVTIKLPAIRGEDGRRWVSSHMNNSKTFFPVDEIEFVKGSELISRVTTAASI